MKSSLKNLSQKTKRSTKTLSNKDLTVFNKTVDLEKIMNNF